MNTLKRILCTLAVAAAFSSSQAVAFDPVAPVVKGGTGAATAGGALDNLTGASTTGVQLLNRTANDTWTTQAAYPINAQCNLLSYRPDFYGSPTIAVANAVMTPGASGTTTYTDDKARAVIMQDFLLDCQRKSITVGAQHFASTHIPSCIRAVTTAGAFTYSTKTPVVLPRYVCSDDAFSWERNGKGSTSASSSWNGDPTTEQLVVAQRPMIYMPIGYTMYPGAKSISNLNSDGTDRGTGYASGYQWQIGSVTLRSNGTGIPGSSATCVVKNGDTVTPASSASFTIAVSGGAATSVTSSFVRYTNGGQYTLPPWAQRRQYTLANGWDGSDSRHPRVFADETNFYYKTTCGGVDYGLTVSATWQPDWCTGSAVGEGTSCTVRTDGPNGTNSFFGLFSNGTSITSDLGNIYAVQSGNLFDSAYGYTWGVMIDGFETTANFIQTQVAHYGLLMYGADVYVNHFNDVGSAIQLKMRGGGSHHVAYARLDTPTDSLGSDAHCLEVDNQTGSSDVKGTCFYNGNASTTAGVAQARFGTDTSISSATKENSGFIFGPMSFSSNGTGGGNMTAIDCNYTRGSFFNAIVSNLSNSGSARSQQFTKFLNFGTNCESSNFFTGTIDGVAGSIFSGTDSGAGMWVWDGYAAGFAAPRGTYFLYGSGAPVDGTTGLNKAGKASLYFDYTNGKIYKNTAASSATVWVEVGGTASLTPVALTDASTVSWDLQAAPQAKLTPTQSFTLSNPTNITAGQAYTLVITQDGTGSRIITWGSAYKFPGGTKFVLSTTAAAVDIVNCYAPTTSIVHCVGQADMK